MSEKKECVTHYACDCIQARIGEIEKSRDDLQDALDDQYHAYGLLKEKCDGYRTSLEKIKALGIYCCDGEGLGHECEAVIIAEEALESK